MFQVWLHEYPAAAEAKPLHHCCLLDDLTDTFYSVFDLLFDQDNIDDGDTIYFLKGSNRWTSDSMVGD